MCGIYGLVEPPTDGRRQVLGGMGQALAHRGPDAHGTYERDLVALGVQRLAIVDVANGHQPATDESGEIVAVLNGEIYNHEHLRSRLEQRGHRLESGSDSAIIPHLYEELGERFVDELNGMFAIALWDGRTNSLLLIRDRLGQKPLYYRHTGSRVAFASELKALMLDPATSRDIDHLAVSDYLTFQYVPAPRTILEQVKKVPPAHIVRITGESLVSERYWALEFSEQGKPSAIRWEEAQEEFRHRLLESVRLRMSGERPIGAFLSGGIDSSSVVAAMATLSSERVPTFAIGFDEPSHDEREYARRVSSLFDTDHHELVMSAPGGDGLRTIARSFDEPFADSSAIPSHQLASLARSEVVVALGGDGGDEAFGGYLRYTALTSRRVRTTRRLRRAARRGAALLGGAETRRWAQATAPLGTTDAADVYAGLLSHFTPEQKTHVLSDASIERIDDDGLDSWRTVRRLWSDHADTDVVNRMLAVDTSSYLPGDLLTKLDTTTMAFSLEGRSPFLDHTLLEWAASLPGGWKTSGRQTKILMRSALEAWLPQDILDRRKQGFGVPMASWVRGPLREVIRDTFADPVAVDTGLIRPGVHTATLDAHLRGARPATHVYSLLMLDLWLRECWSRPAAGL